MRHNTHAATMCRVPGCRALVWWGVTENGKPIPMDQEPHPNGNCVVAESRRDGTIIIHVLKGREVYTDHRQRLLPHKATCGGKPRPPVTPIGPPPPEQPELDLFNEGE